MRGAFLVTMLAAAPLAAQGPGFQLGHLFTDPSATSYRVDVSGRILGPVGGDVHATVVDGRKPMGNLWGVGTDVSLFRSGASGVYLIGGVEGGVATQGSKTFWGSWSAGVGYEFFPLRGVSLAAEGRYRGIDGRYDGIEIGARLGLDRGSRRASRGGGGSGAAASTASLATAGTDPAPEPAEIRAELDRAGVAPDRSQLIGDVVQEALDVMGMPYRWGDEGEEGFDCSGLIRYAFGRHGVSLPRRSADQAREGTAVTKDLEALRAGDILTFANGGSRVSHVGLYLGNGKFIHSASRGVQISILGPDDPAGRWWYRRWVGARRIID